MTFLGFLTERAERDAGPSSCCKLFQEDEVPGRTQEASHVSLRAGACPGARGGEAQGWRLLCWDLNLPCTIPGFQERLPEVLPGAAVQRGTESPASEGAHGGDRQPLAAHLPEPEGALQEAG